MTANLIWGLRYYACGCRVPDPAVSNVTASGPCPHPSRHGGPLLQDTSQVARTGRLYGCAKRGCDAVNPDYLSFGTSEGLGYCLHHIPIRSRLRLWWHRQRPTRLWCRFVGHLDRDHYYVPPSPVCLRCGVKL